MPVFLRLDFSLNKSGICYCLMGERKLLFSLPPACRKRYRCAMIDNGLAQTHQTERGEKTLGFLSPVYHVYVHQSA